MKHENNSIYKDSSLLPMTIGNQKYTCPMHPEIIQDHSGTCSKCGMALEPTINLADEMPKLN